MSQHELLRLVVQILERMGLDYFITGSLASMYFGESRLTNDVDVVVALPPHRVAEFCQSFPSSEFYVSQEAAIQAAQAHGQFNIIQPDAGLKVDVIVPSDTPFDRSRFARKRIVPAGHDFSASFASPEDVIVKKLQYYAEGGSEKHLRDISGMLRINGQRIDRHYIERWAGELGVLDIWQMIRKKLGEA